MTVGSPENWREMVKKQDKDRKPGLPEWCDFVRGVADPDRTEQLRRILESGDESAMRQVATMNRVRQLAQGDRAATPPDHAVRMTRAVFAMHDPPERSPWHLLPLELLYDSRREPVVAGTRNLYSNGCEIHVRSGELFVDVRLDEQGQSKGWVIVGEFLRGTAIREPVSNVPVVITCDDQVIATAATTSFGEFHSEGDQRGELAVSLLVSDTECLRVDLPTPLDEEAE